MLTVRREHRETVEGLPKGELLQPASVLVTMKRSKLRPEGIVPVGREDDPFAVGVPERVQSLRRRAP